MSLCFSRTTRGVCDLARIAVIDNHLGLAFPVDASSMLTFFAHAFGSGQDEYSTMEWVHVTTFVCFPVGKTSQMTDGTRNIIRTSICWAKAAPPRAGLLIIQTQV
jgi:hypothetical protein